MWKTAQKERKRTAKAEKNLHICTFGLFFVKNVTVTKFRFHEKYHLKTERVTLDIMTTLIPIDGSFASRYRDWMPGEYLRF